MGNRGEGGPGERPAGQINLTLFADACQARAGYIFSFFCELHKISEWVFWNYGPFALSVEP
jgi:hypothetical protein